MRWVFRVKVRDLKDRVMMEACAWWGERMVIWSGLDSIKNVHGPLPDRVGWMR
jgi:hypothetical protein